jgi:hypothetical protein
VAVLVRIGAWGKTTVNVREASGPARAGNVLAQVLYEAATARLLADLAAELGHGLQRQYTGTGTGIAGTAADAAGTHPREPSMAEIEAITDATRSRRRAQHLVRHLHVAPGASRMPRRSPPRAVRHSWHHGENDASHSAVARREPTEVTAAARRTT